MPAPLALFGRLGGRNPSPRAPHESKRAQDHRRQLNPHQTRNQARPTRGQPPNRSAGYAESRQRWEHSECAGQSQDPDHGKKSTRAGVDDRRFDVSVTVRGVYPICRDRSPPLSRAPLPRGCATSNCPAMLIEIWSRLTSANEFRVGVY